MQNWSVNEEIHAWYVSTEELVVQAWYVIVAQRELHFRNLAATLLQQQSAYGKTYTSPTAIYTASCLVLESKDQATARMALLEQPESSTEQVRWADKSFVCSFWGGAASKRSLPADSHSKGKEVTKNTAEGAMQTLKRCPPTHLSELKITCSSIKRGSGRKTGLQIP